MVGPVRFPDEHEREVVRGTDVLAPTLIGHADCYCETPPQPESEARVLIRELGSQ
jgi:hypothetical protein